jgi:3-oxoacyl-[acyl-carrier-protein] synthase-1
MIDAEGEPLRVAVAPWLDIDCQGQKRLEALLFPAIEQALAPCDPQRHEDIRMALALALPSPRPGVVDDLERSVRQSIADAYPNRFSAVATFPVGHAAGFVAMHAACAKMLARGFDLCVLAGVDSYLEPETLGWLEESDQLHGAGPLNNAWGFVPGEGAGAGLLASGEALARLGLEPLARVLSVGRGFEQNRIRTETVCTGQGLTTAFREALAGLPPGRHVTDVFCDMNGEPYRADEFGFACLRTKEAFVSASDFVAPADCWGDVSAASAMLGLVLAAIAWQKRYAKGPYALVWASSESGERGAALLEFPADARV